MREIRPSGSEGGARFKPLSLPLSRRRILSCAPCCDADASRQRRSSYVPGGRSAAHPFLVPLKRASRAHSQQTLEEPKECRGPIRTSEPSCLIGAVPRHVGSMSDLFLKEYSVCFP